MRANLALKRKWKKAQMTNGKSRGFAGAWRSAPPTTCERTQFRSDASWHCHRSADWSRRVATRRDVADWQYAHLPNTIRRNPDASRCIGTSLRYKPASIRIGGSAKMRPYANSEMCAWAATLVRANPEVHAPIEKDWPGSVELPVQAVPVVRSKLGRIHFLEVRSAGGQDGPGIRRQERRVTYPFLARGRLAFGY